MHNLTIAEWNNEITVNLIPSTVILCVYILLGVCGNLLVIAVYTVQMKEIPDERYFIPVLAVLDLVTTVYCSAFGIVQNVHFVTFFDRIGCQTAQFFVGLTTFMPIVVLLIIAVQRYLKVCKPLKPSMTRSFKRRLLLVATCISFLVALPIPFVYGTVPFYYTRYHITGSHCGKLRQGDILSSAAYIIVIGLFAVIVVVMLILLYAKIGYAVYHQLQVMKRKEKDKEKRNRSDTTTKTDDSFVENSQATSATENETTSNELSKSKSKVDSLALNSTNHNNHLDSNIKSGSFRSCRSKKQRRTNRRITYKLTCMFIVITVVFLLSYIPKVIVLLLEGIHEDFWERLSNTERPGVMFVYLMFLINNIANPIIYAFMDKKFWRETKKFLKKICFC